MCIYIYVYKPVCRRLIVYYTNSRVKMFARERRRSRRKIEEEAQHQRVKSEASMYQEYVYTTCPASSRTYSEKERESKNKVTLRQSSCADKMLLLLLLVRSCVLFFFSFHTLLSHSFSGLLLSFFYVCFLIRCKASETLERKRQLAGSLGRT